MSDIMNFEMMKMQSKGLEEDWNLVKQGNKSLVAELEEWRLKAEDKKIRGIGRSKCNPNEEE